MKSKVVRPYNMILSILGLLFLISCDTQSKSDLQLEIVSKRTLEEVPSASGVEILNDAIYMVGDNSPWLFKLDRQYQILDKFPIFSLADLEDGFLPKAIKPDFEAMTLANWKSEKELLLFGSGSKSPERDLMVIVGLGNREDDITTYSLVAFYQKIRAAANLTDEELNIEGAAVKDGDLYLFNRGKNIIMKYDLDAFLRHIIGNEPCPDPQIFEINLPAVKGVEAGFSGAVFVPGNEKLLFTASVENTENWIDDGEILGSFVGVIDLSDLKSGLTPQCFRIISDGQPLNIKVESVTVQNVSRDTELDIILVTDSDGGYSELLEAKLK